MANHHAKFKKRRTPLILRRMPWIILGIFIGIAIFYFGPRAWQAIPAYVEDAPVDVRAGNIPEQLKTYDTLIDNTEQIEINKYDTYNYEVIFNQYRESYDLIPLIFTGDLNDIAIQRLSEIKIDFSHNSPRVRYLGENIAMGVANNQEVLESWANSPLHAMNMLGLSYKYTGYAAGDGYAVQIFSEWVTFNGIPQLPPGFYFVN